jgi:hypothetical protein
MSLYESHLYLSRSSEVFAVFHSTRYIWDHMGTYDIPEPKHHHTKL